MNFSRKTQLSSEIPTSSMPDIIFMLLIFFMVTTVLREYSGLPVNIPKEKQMRVEVLEDLPLCMPDQYKETGSRWYGYAVDCYQKFVTQDKPYMEDVFKAYTRAITSKAEDSTMSSVEYPPQWVAQNATPEQMKHITLHKLMNPESAV